MTRQDLTFATGTVGLMIVTALAFVFIFLWPEIRDWLIARTVVPVPVVTSCRPPAETEQLHIVTWSREGRIYGQCLYVGSRGTYYRSRSGMPEPRP